MFTWSLHFIWSRSVVTCIVNIRLHGTQLSMASINGCSSGQILEMTPSGQVVQIDPNRVVYSNSNVAVVDKRKYQSTGDIKQGQQSFGPLGYRDRRMSEGGTSNMIRRQSQTPASNGNSSKDKLMTTKRDTGTQPSHYSQMANLVAPKASGVAQFLYNLWKDQKMCDIIIKVGESEFMAHKIALAASSEKFSKKFIERMCQPQDMTEILLKGVSPATVQQILDYIYTSNIEINIGCIDQLLTAAKQLGLVTLVDLCKQNLMTFTLNTVLIHYKISGKHELTDTLDHLDKYINDRFLDIVNTDEYKSADIDMVLRILSEENLNILSELDVYNAAISWIDHNRQERLTYAASVMSTVRFIHISPQDIATTIETTKPVFQIKECKDMLYDAFRYQALRYSDSDLVSNMDIPRVRGSVVRHFESKIKSEYTPSRNTQVFKTGTPSYEYKEKSNPYNVLVPDTPYPTRRLPFDCSVLLVAGGVNPYAEECELPGRLVEQYNPKTNSWHLLTKMPDARHHHGAAIMGNCLYVIGGSVMVREDPGDLANPTNVCYKYDPARNTWSQITPMFTKRMYHSVTVFRGHIYALGGQDDLQQILDSVEYYDDNAKIWINSHPMTERKIGATSIEFKGLLYVIGGFLETPSHNFALSTVECFNPITNSWTRNNPLPIPLCHANVVKVSDRLFLIGGSTMLNSEEPVTSLPSVLSYREHEDTWEEIAELRIPRHDAGAATIGSRIFVVGGANSLERRTLNEMECYDVDEDAWIEEMTSLNHPSLGIVCCALNEDVQI